MPRKNNVKEVSEEESVMQAFSTAEDLQSKEGHKALSDVLDIMIKQLKEEQMMTGSLYYDNLLAAAEEVQKYCGKLDSNDISINNEGLYASLRYLQGQSERYLNYKKLDGESRGSANEKKRMNTVKMIREISASGAERLGDKINASRKIGMQGIIGGSKRMNPHNQIESQMIKLESLQGILQKTSGFGHGSGDYFKTMMKDLKDALRLSQELNNTKLYDTETNQQYLKSLEKLQKSTNAYLNYKRNNNDFGETSLSRIRAAGSLELLLKQIVPAADYYCIQLDPDRENAEKWFDSMTRELAVKTDQDHPESGLKTPVNLSEPFSASRVFITDPDNYISKEQLDHAMDQGTGYPEKLQTVQKYMYCRHMAFARIGSDNQPLHPYKNPGNVAEYIMNEAVTKKEDFSLRHKLHLYHMAKENRLFVQRLNPDYSPEGCKFDQITVGADGKCSIVKDEALPEKDDFQNVFMNNNRHVKAEGLLGAIADQMKQGHPMKQSQLNSFLEQTGKLHTQEFMMHIASYFPEWFRNKSDAKLLEQLCSGHTTLHSKYGTEKNKELTDQHVMWNEKELKAAKAFLKAVNVKSFDELLRKHTITYEKQPVQTAKTGFQLADNIFHEILKSRTVCVDGKYYAMRDNEIKKVNRDVNRTPEDYIQAFSKLENDALKIILGTEKSLKNIEGIKSDTIRKTQADPAYRPMQLSLATLVDEMRETAGNLQQANQMGQRVNRPLYYEEVAQVVKPLNVGFKSIRVRAMKQPSLREQDLKILRCCNRYGDLSDMLQNGINNPQSSLTNRKNLLTARLVDVSAEHKIRTLQDKMKTQELNEQENKERQQARKALLDRDTRKKIMQKFAEDPSVQNTLKIGTDQKMLTLDDQQFLTEFKAVTEKIQKAEKQPSQPELAKDAPQIHNPSIRK